MGWPSSPVENTPPGLYKFSPPHIYTYIYIYIYKTCFHQSRILLFSSPGLFNGHKLHFWTHTILHFGTSRRNSTRAFRIRWVFRFWKQFERVTRFYKFFLTPLTTFSRWSCRIIFGHLWANRLNLKHPNTLQSTTLHEVIVIIWRRLGASWRLWRSICVILPCDHIYGGHHVAMFVPPEPPRGSQTSPTDSQGLNTTLYVLCDVCRCLGLSMLAHKWPTVVHDQCKHVFRGVKIICGPLG